EEIMDWLQANFELENIPVPLQPDWHIVKTAAEGYRFYPDRVKGEGFFITCFRRKSGEEYSAKKQRHTLTAVDKKDRDKVTPWLQDSDGIFMMAHQGEVLLFPEMLQPAVAVLQQHLYLRKAGVKAGQLAAKELIPDHQLSMSPLVAGDVQKVALTREQALKYLRKEDPAIAVVIKGWALMQYGGMSLGWAKVLPNRINNYYPKELRILKEIQA
ncbi:MAG: Fmu (Sun) domain protein, partial [Bacteroidetes bacterium]|nr:Fmu (Sun) domain protein [Bacteroidota bacterium]